MVAEARLKSKNLYKVELYLLKIMPMVIALAYLVNTVSSYFGVDIPILASIAGMSLIPLIFMYISSYVFKFCEYHRMFLHYIAVNDIINIYDWYIGISVTNRELFVLHMSITGISLFIILYLYVKSHKKLTIVIFDRWEELEGSIPQDEMDAEANAITISAYGASLVAVNSRRGSSIVHEAEHIKNHIWQYIGYTPQRDNDEVDAYLLTYIYDKITQVFYKHKDNKE